MLFPTARPSTVPDTPPRDAILVAASPDRALDLLRWATLRSDDVLFVSPSIDETARRYASRFAVAVRKRDVRNSDFTNVAAMLLSLADKEVENAMIRRARRRGVAVHVPDRPLVSDFTVLAMMEQPWPVRRAA